MVGNVHITKDKDVMTVIPKMLMILCFSVSSRFANNEVYQGDVGVCSWS